MERFREGERVKARTSAVVPAGTPGTILHAFLSLPDALYVQFDGYAQPKLIRASDLERADDTPPPARQRPQCGLAHTSAPEART
jgi:hypothetical protein